MISIFVSLKVTIIYFAFGACMFSKDNSSHMLDLINNTLAALEECRIAVEKTIIPLGQPVELLPRSKRILLMQAELVDRYGLSSDVFGNADQKRLRVYPL